MHSAWDLLFYNPDFWGCLSKHEFCNLRLACKDFAAGVPEREAVLWVFRNSAVKKVDLFRVLPLTVHDVMRLKSPVNFADAFKIAERKAGGFVNCMAMVRERSLYTKHVRERQQMGSRDSVLASLLAQGVSNPPYYNPFFRSALDGYVSRVVVWRYVHKRINAGPCFESEEVLGLLRKARGKWYRGIQNHMRDVMITIGMMETWQSITEHMDVNLSGDVLMVGILSIS